MVLNLGKKKTNHSVYIYIQINIRQVLIVFDSFSIFVNIDFAIVIIHIDITMTHVTDWWIFVYVFSQQCGGHGKEVDYSWTRQAAMKQGYEVSK